MFTFAEITTYIDQGAAAHKILMNRKVDDPERYIYTLTQSDTYSYFLKPNSGLMEESMVPLDTNKYSKITTNIWNIGRTRKHLVELQKNVSRAFQKTEIEGYINDPRQENLDASAILNHQLHPRILAWPDKLQSTIEEYYQTYTDGMMLVMGGDLFQAYNKYFGDTRSLPTSLPSLAKQYGLYIVNEDTWRYWNGNGPHWTHSFWYKFIPRRCIEVEMSGHYYYNVTRIPRYQKVELQIAKKVKTTILEPVPTIDMLNAPSKPSVNRWRAV